jgi:5-methylcytosine-specific restriction endonuclease McrA
MTRELCSCGTDFYDAEEYSSCYHCFLERRSDYLSCIYCGRWHNPKYEMCWRCAGEPSGRAEREEAARSLREAIMARDRFECYDCAATDHLQIDHVKPCAKGGNARPWNLLTRCLTCNQLKGAQWYPGCVWEADREMLLRAYFTYLRGFLNEEERTALRAEVEAWRQEHGPYVTGLTGLRAHDKSEVDA